LILTTVEQKIEKISMKRSRQHDDNNGEEPNEKLQKPNCEIILNHQSFPADCFTSILQYCNAEQLENTVPLVCSGWRNTLIESSSNVLWKKLCLDEYPILEIVDEETFAMDWRTLFKKYSAISRNLIIQGTLYAITVL
jgi:hypothetical protein